MRLGDLAQAQRALLENSNPIDIEWPPTDMPALQPGAAHSCPHPFDDEMLVLLLVLEGDSGSDIQFECP